MDSSTACDEILDTWPAMLLFLYIFYNCPPPKIPFYHCLIETLNGKRAADSMRGVRNRDQALESSLW